MKRFGQDGLPQSALMTRVAAWSRCSRFAWVFVASLAWTGCCWSAGSENHVLPPAKTPIPIAVGAQLGDITFKCLEKTSGRCTITDLMHYARVCALLVIKSGQMRLERYNQDPEFCRADDKTADGPKKLYGLASVTKSLTSTLLGQAIAIGRGAVTKAEFEAVVRKPVDAFIPELAPKGAYSGVALEDVLNMRSGVDWREDDSWLWGAGDATKFHAQVRNPRDKTVVEFSEQYGPSSSGQAGKTFNYSALDTAIVAIAAERIAGGAKLGSFLQSRLWQSIGSEGRGRWAIDKADSAIGPCCMRMTARDLAKFGMLVLNQGRTAKGQAIPKAWFDLALRSGSAPAHEIPADNVSYNRGCPLAYRYFWWLFPSRTHFTAVGVNGQFLHIYPSEDVVIVQISDWGTWNRGNYRECESFRAHDALVNAVK